jgi:hypothetical protein
VIIGVLSNEEGRMATVPPMTTNGHIDLTQEEAYALLDREARRALHMSAQDFIAAWEAGEFDADPDRPEVMYVAMLLPLAQ